MRGMATLSSHLHRWHRSFMRHIATSWHELCLPRISRCLQPSSMTWPATASAGGWLQRRCELWLFGFSVRRHSSTVPATPPPNKPCWSSLGWLPGAREAQRGKQHWDQTYWYYRPSDPLTSAKISGWANRQGAPLRASAVAGSERSTKTIQNPPTKTGAPQRSLAMPPKAELAIPDADATRPNLKTPCPADDLALVPETPRLS